jgi:hypothetical protein
VSPGPPETCWSVVYEDETALRTARGRVLHARPGRTACVVRLPARLVAMAFPFRAPSDGGSGRATGNAPFLFPSLFKSRRARRGPMALGTPVSHANRPDSTPLNWFRHHVSCVRFAPGALEVAANRPFRPRARRACSSSHSARFTDRGRPRFGLLRSRRAAGDVAPVRGPSPPPALRPWFVGPVTLVLPAKHRALAQHHPRIIEALARSVGRRPI